MAYQKKYYYTFKQLGTNKTNLVEIWQDTDDVLVDEEVIGMRSPFTVELPGLDHKFQVVRGQGCNVSLLSTSDRKFLDGLYHVDPVEYQVRHYIDGQYNYLGYLNSEMYMESFSESYNYGISVTGNDGFALADRFTFLDETESNYTGIKSKFELLMICLNRIGLPWSEVRIALATTFTGYSGAANSTILHESYVDCANFYDEDNYPMTIREVIESILAPYGANIWSEKGYIYVIDMHTKATGGSVVFKAYNYNTEAYLYSVASPINKTIQSIGYQGTGQTIEISGGVNKQVVSYSPYPFLLAIDKSISTLSEFGTVPASWTLNADGYYVKQLLDNDTWEAFSPASFESSYYAGDENEAYLKFATTATDYVVADIKEGPYLSVVSENTGIGRPIFDVYFWVKGKIFFRTKNNPYDQNESNSNVLTYARTSFVLYVGTDGRASFNFNYSPAQDLANDWQDIDMIIPIGKDDNLKTFFNGNFNLEIHSDHRTSFNSASQVVNDTKIKEVWIKDIEITVTDMDGNELSDEDVEYIGELDYTYKEEGKKIELTTGTDARKADRAKILKYNGSDYSIINEWTRNSQSAKIEELLLVSATSNYRRGFYTLSNFRLKQGFSNLNLISDTNITGKVFMLKSARYDYEENLVDCTLWEISPDNLTIE